MSSFKKYMRTRKGGLPAPVSIDKYDVDEFLKWCYDMCFPEHIVLVHQKYYNHNLTLDQVKKQFQEWDEDETK